MWHGSRLNKFFLACHYLPLQSFSNSPVEPCILGSRSNSFRRWRLRMRRWRPEWSPNEWASKTTPTKVMPSAQLRTPLVHLYRLYIFIHNITMTYHRYVYIYTIYIYIYLCMRKSRMLSCVGFPCLLLLMTHNRIVSTCALRYFPLIPLSRTECTANRLRWAIETTQFVSSTKCLKQCRSCPDQQTSIKQLRSSKQEL